ncbi:MAG: hypothetical protein AB7D92_12175 [Sphaerochaeta sp.]|jgi:hypothetical protein
MEKVIGLYGKGDSGKSRTLYLLAKLLIENGALLLRSTENIDFFNDNPLRASGTTCDFRAVFTLNDKIIGITSKGDNDKEMESNLQFLKEGAECDIVFSATLSRGVTTNALFSYAEDHSAVLIWVAKSYYADNTTIKPTPSQFDMMNNLEAQFMFNLI